MTSFPQPPQGNVPFPYTQPMPPGATQPAPLQAGTAASGPKKAWYARWWVWVIIILVLAGIGNATKSSSTTDPGGASAGTSTKTERLTLDKGWAAESEGMFAYVNGYVSNNSDQAISSYAQISFDALDSSGANVGTCLGNTNTIDAHGRWKFKALCSGSDMATVRFKDVTGF